MNIGGLEVTVHYAENGDDREFGSYPATIEGLEEQSLLAHPSLRGSGFGSVKVTCQGYEEAFSPWELVSSDRRPARPSLSDEDKKLVMDKLNEQLRKGDINEYFSRPVDQARYSDYWSMVEIEMSIFFIKRRLEENYYGSKLSVVGDVRLIRDNCIKYNSIVNDLSAVASEMCTDFERSVLSVQEQSQLITEEEFATLVNSPRTPESFSRLRSRGASVVTTVGAPTYDLRERGRIRRRSSLEALPQPEPPSTRRSLRNDSEDEPSRPRRSTRSLGSAPETEVLDRLTRRRAGVRPNYGEDAESEGSDVMTDERTQENDSSNADAISSRRRSTRSFGDQSSTGIDNADEDRAEPIRPSRRRPSRSVLHTSSSEADEDSDHDDSAVDSEASDVQSVASEDEDSVESEVLAPRRRTRRAVGQQQSMRSSPRTRKSLSRNQSPNSPSRRPTRAAAKKKARYEDVDSDVDLPEAEPSSGSEDEKEEPQRKPRAVRAISYADPSSSESEDETKSELVSKRNSRKRSATPRASRSKRAKVVNESDLPSLEDWPHIPLKSISEVARTILEKVHELDEDDVFAVPVLETYPDIKDDYLAVVESPLDLRTIEEEHIQQYKSIRELQQDLTLVFKNCCIFNETGSDLWNYSIGIWTQMNHVFTNSCNELDVRLPRRWQP
eukprot:scaffold1340_cov122-Cylindrotheca_fusiformis.AAC.11